MSSAQLADANEIERSTIELGEPYQVGNRWSINAERLGDLLMTEVEFFDEGAHRKRSFRRVQVISLEVFDERELR